MKKKIDIDKMQEEAGKAMAENIELRLWWNNYQMFADKEVGELLKLLDKLVLNARYVRNRDRSFGSEYYNVATYIFKMAHKPINDKV